MDGNQSVKHICVINPKAFKHKADMEAFISECTRSMEGRDLTVHVSRFPRDAIGAIRGIAANRAPPTHIRVYAVGGDGILFDCLNGVVGLERADIAPVPYGAENDFALAFGDDGFESFRNISLLADAPALPTDVIHSMRNYALNFCALGLEADVDMRIGALKRAIARPLGTPGKISTARYALIREAAIVSCAFRKSVIRQYYRVSVDGEDLSGYYATINIANGPRYGGGKAAVIRATPDDGWLDALFTKTCGPADVLKMAPSYLNGRYQKFPDKIFSRRGKKFSISSDTPMIVSMDGEIFYDTQLTLEIVPAAVRIVAPAGAAYVRRDEPYA